MGRRIPHMGWNEIELTRTHAVFAELGEAPHVYFTHSYAFETQHDEHIAATTDYGQTIVAAVARDNIFGMQFHPEKSQDVGLKILSNFLTWTP